MYSPLVARPILLPQNLLQDFPRPTLRQGVAKLKRFGNFEPCEVLSAMFRDLSLGNLTARLEGYEGPGDLAPFFVGHGDDRALEHRGVLVKHALDFRRGHVLA